MLGTVDGRSKVSVVSKVIVQMMESSSLVSLKYKKKMEEAVF